MSNGTETEMKIKLILIRHGTTKSNEDKKYLGKTDEALSESGKREIENKKSGGKYPKAQLVVASSMKRCVQTAEIIYESSPDILVDSFREIDFGLFEGKDYKELSQYPSYQKWIDSKGTLPIPNGESKEQFTQRCRSGFLSLCEELKKQIHIPETIAFIVHSGTIMAILEAFAAGEYYSFQCDNGEGYCCELTYEETIKIQKIEKL